MLTLVFDSQSGKISIKFLLHRQNQSLYPNGQERFSSAYLGIKMNNKPALRLHLELLQNYNPKVKKPVTKI